MEGEIKSTLDSIKIAGDEISVFARSMNSLMGTKDDQLARIVDKTEIALENFNKAMAGIDSIMGDEQLKGRLRESVDKVPVMFDQAQNTLDASSRIRSASSTPSPSARNTTWRTSRKSRRPWENTGEEITQNLMESHSQRQ